VKLAVDIGTTLIKAESLDGSFKQTIENPQKKFSPNVLGRVSEAISGKSLELRDCLMESLERLAIESACNEMAITGNSVMLYILLGLDMNVFIPPYNSFKELMIEKREIAGICVYTLPCFYPFFGADALGMLFKDNIMELDNFIAVDFGTNCEIAAGNGEKILMTSVPAGPAFEGEGIECGKPAIDGAICSVHISKQLEISTIGKKKANGICGSGLISLISELKRKDLLDGCIIKPSPWTKNGIFYITPEVFIKPEDIEEFLKAWASVRTGIEYVYRYIRFNNTHKLKISGNFLSTIKQEDLFYLGLADKNTYIEYSGNTSLDLAISFLKNPDIIKKSIENIKNRMSYLELAKFSDFSDVYFRNFKV